MNPNLTGTSHEYVQQQSPAHLKIQLAWCLYLLF